MHVKEVRIDLWNASNWQSGKTVNMQKKFTNYLLNFTSIQLDSVDFISVLSKPFRSPGRYSVLEILNTHFSLSIPTAWWFFVI